MYVHRVQENTFYVRTQGIGEHILCMYTGYRRTHSMYVHKVQENTFFVTNSRWVGTKKHVDEEMKSTGVCVLSFVFFFVFFLGAGERRREEPGGD